MAANALSICFADRPELTESEQATAQSISLIRVISVDDHPTLRTGIATIVDHQKDMKLIGAASSGREGIRMFRELQPDVTLMDLRLPDLSGVEALISIRSEFREARVLILTTFDSDLDILRSLQAGAAGYLLKSTSGSDLVAAIRNVHRGKKIVPPEIATQVAQHLNYEALSNRETEVLRYLAGGNRNKDIARLLFISEETVKAHVKHLLEKLGAKDRTHALAIAVQKGIIRI